MWMGDLSPCGLYLLVVVCLHIELVQSETWAVGLQPDNVTLLADESTRTCTVFTATRPQQSKVYEASTCPAANLMVTLIGHDLGCTTALYVAWLEESEPIASGQKMSRCTMTGQTMGADGTEWCSFQCSGTGSWQTIMVANWPRTLSESSWTLCDIKQHCAANLCPYVPCHHGGQCIGVICECPSYCSGDYCQDCAVDPDPPIVPLNVGGQTINVIMHDGWIVLMRRRDGTVIFHPRTWDEFKNGFGNLSSEFWLGNDYINQLTTNGSQFKLHCEFLTETGLWMWAEYDNFQVGDENSDYILTISGYVTSSTAEDKWTESHTLNGMKFTAPGHDNDLAVAYGNCADGDIGSWWYSGCADVKFTGYWHDPTPRQLKYSVKWLPEHNLHFVDMRIQVV